MLIVDAHQDLAWNMLSFQRDYTRSVEETRRAEAGSRVIELNDDSLLGWPEYQRGQVALVFATLFATPQRFCMGGWDAVCYTDANDAYRMYQIQLDLYQRLCGENPDKFSFVQSRQDLEQVLRCWEEAGAKLQETSGDGATCPVGLVPLMENAEAVRHPGELEEWWQRGVHLIGPAWAGTRYCGGTREPGPLTSAGVALLERMGDLGFALDLSHMDEQAALQALDLYPGVVVASHSNALALVKDSSTNRHLSDRVIQGILERDGVIGVVPFNAFLMAGWRRGDQRAKVQITEIVAQIDYICQMAGNAHHAGLGTDFDGGFGLQSVPPGIESVADLQKLGPLLAEKGYANDDIAAILGQNWIDRLRKFLPESA